MRERRHRRKRALRRGPRWFLAAEGCPLESNQHTGRHLSGRATKTATHPNKSAPIQKRRDVLEDYQARDEGGALCCLSEKTNEAKR